MYKRNRSSLGDLPQPEGRPITYADLQSAIPEVYGTRHPDGSVTGIPPITPIALDQAFTALLEQKRAEGDTEFQFRPGGGDVAYAQLVQQYGSLASIEELLERYPLVVDWLARRARVGEAYEAQKWEVFRGERASIDPDALDASAGAPIVATAVQQDQARRSSELPPCLDCGPSDAGPGAGVPSAVISTSPYATTPTGRPDLVAGGSGGSGLVRAESSGRATVIWLGTIAGLVFLVLGGRRRR